jgi:hypothetical protein
MRQLWTDDELDQALAKLHADVRPNPNGLAAARERVLNPTPQRRFRRPWLPVVAAAAAAALVTTVLVLLPHTAQPAAPPAATTKAPLPTPTPIDLPQLLAQIRYSDPTVAPGQFRYVRDEVWGSGTDGDPSKPLTEGVTTTWQPAKWTDQWLRQDGPVGMRTAKYANGVISATGPEDKFSVHPFETRAGCADFDSVNPQVTGHLPCQNQKGWWLTPNPDWLAGLPKTPQGMAAKLTADTAGAGPSMAPLYFAIYALKSGVFPADVRKTLWQAIALLPGAYGLRNVANLDGKLGFAIGIVTNGITDEILIDPADGTYLGERQFNAANGSVFLFSAMRYGVVDGQGVTPK